MTRSSIAAAAAWWTLVLLLLTLSQEVRGNGIDSIADGSIDGGGSVDLGPPTDRAAPSLDVDGDDGDDDGVVDPLERLLLDTPSPSSLRSYLRALTRTSHVAGTPGDYADAHYVLDQFLSFGFDAVLEEVDVMLSAPRSRPSLSAPSIGYEAALSEDDLGPFDPTSGATRWRNHTFVAYSPSGSVSAPLVYANYGRPQDFDALENAGVSVEGKIVLVRYGECFRGLKAMNAESRGAAGTVLYSDPEEDGFTRGEVYPNGPWRPESAVQRGSVQFNTRCAGDPYRLYLDDKNDGGEGGDGEGGEKGGGGTERVCGYRPEDLIPSAPVLPISYGDAAPLMAKLGGPAPPPGFRGGLKDVPYSVGPSPFNVELTVDMELIPGKIPNVLATIPATAPHGCSDSGPVILGNHRDAWVFGAADPNSGTSALLETARTFSTLLSRGWEPRRPIVLASWSGEEYGLLGSTAFAEMKEGEAVMEDAVAYLNVDIAVAGPGARLTAAATHSLGTLFYEAAGDVPAPPPDVDVDAGGGPTITSMADLWIAAAADDDHGPPPTNLDSTVPTSKMGTLGSGSDYTAFLDRYGIPSLDMSYRGEYGVYHSVYDSFAWMDSYGDPTYERHRAVTRLWALMAYRLASRDVLPFHMTTQAEYISAAVGDMQARAEETGVDLTGLEEAAEDFRRAAVEADRESIALEEKKGDLNNGSGEATEVSTMNAVRGAAEKEPGGGNRARRRGRPSSPLSTAAFEDLNRRLSRTERRFLVDSGLPRRPWFRHVLQAPGYYLGYGSRSFPGVAEALDDADTELAGAEAEKAAGAVRAAAKFLSGRSADGEESGGGGIMPEGAGVAAADVSPSSVGE